MTSKYLVRITLFDLIHLMSMVNPIVMGVETSRIVGDL